MASPSFSAALLAGGQSTRMGRDKAFLPVPGSDLFLWQWQWRTLQKLEPAEIFWSGFTRPGLPEDIRVVPDAVSSVGPLGGLSACLDATRTDLLAVLAVDLPQMSAAFLSRLLSRCSARCGIVARRGDFFEPLAAVYPQQAGVLAANHLAQGRHALQDLIRVAVAQGLLREFVLDEEDFPLFKNVNSPPDMADLLPHPLA